MGTYWILVSLILFVCILLILVVMVQNPKGGGLSTDFGSASQLGGVKKTNEFIDKLTWSLAAIIVVSSIVITMRQPKAIVDTQKQGTQQGQEKNPQGQNPQGQDNGGKK